MGISIALQKGDRHMDVLVSSLLIAGLVLAAVLTAGAVAVLMMRGNRKGRITIIFSALGCILLAIVFLAFPLTRSQQPADSTAQTQATDIHLATQAEIPAEAPTEPLPDPEDSDFVRVQDWIPEIFIELKYATEDNFTGKVIYSFQDAFLRYGTVKKLQAASAILNEQGVYLKIWDGFRPVSAQFSLWEAYPDPSYVANPTVGHSSHSRGNTLDVTLVYGDGTPVEMPTGFDDFTALADRNYADCPDSAGRNALLLQEVMYECGFEGYFMEWWHFSDSQEYPVETCFDPALISDWLVAGDQDVRLLDAPDELSAVLVQIAPGEQVQVIGYEGNYAMAQYRNRQGYILAENLEPKL